MENIPQQQQNATIDNDVPMDEFEFKGQQRPSAKNILKYIKLALIGVAVTGILVVAVVGVNIILQNQTQPTQTASATTTPTPSPTATEIPVAQLPTEYQELQQKIDEYEKTTNSTSETRTRLNVPIMNVIVSF